MEITRGVIQTAQKVVIYGPEGIGKTTFAAQFPEPLFIDTEGSTKHLDVARLPKPTSWAMLLEEVKDVAAHPDVCKTLVLDTADWSEQFATDAVCDRAKKNGIEDFGYGKGYVYLAEEFGNLLAAFDDVIAAGVNVVLTAHAKMRKFEQPDEMGAYDRWEMKLSKNVAPLVKEWADMVLFANYKVLAVKLDDGKTKAQGGKRVMYATHHPCWDAKNRHGLPDEMPLDYAQIAAAIGTTEAKPAPKTKSKGTAKAAPAAPEKKTEPAPEPEKPAAAIPPSAPDADFLERRIPGPDEIGQALHDLMTKNEVYEDEIQIAVSDRGYFPLDMPMKDYPKDFISGSLVSAWDKVFGMVKKNRDNIPF